MALVTRRRINQLTSEHTRWQPPASKRGSDHQDACGGSHACPARSSTADYVRARLAAVYEWLDRLSIRASICVRCLELLYGVLPSSPSTSRNGPELVSQSVSASDCARVVRAACSRRETNTSPNRGVCACGPRTPTGTRAGGRQTCTLPNTYSSSTASRGLNEGGSSSSTSSSGVKCGPSSLGMGTIQ